MKCIINMLKIWAAAFFLGAVLTGCGGGSGGSASPGLENSAVLSWSAPERRVNGEGIKMAELDRYIIRYGQDADKLDREIVIPDAQAKANMTHRVTGLGAGVWYFTILVQDNNGLLSPPSEVVDKEIES